MKRLALLCAAVFLVAACTDPKEPDVTGNTPDPSAADGLVTPGGDADAPECWVDDDCADLMETAGQCQMAACEDGACVLVDAYAGTPCASDATGECQIAVCAIGADGGIGCTGTSAAPDGTPCGEVHAACGTASTCHGGFCTDPCDDENPCTDDKCTSGGCVFTPNTGGCDDINPCTEDDTCADGECIGDWIDGCECWKHEHCEEYEDGDLCNGTLWCLENVCTVKTSTIIECEVTGDEPCHGFDCVPETGDCVEYMLEDGAECDDGNVCTAGVTCIEGMCIGVEEITCEFDCNDELDEDEDGWTDCEDTDCYGVGECLVPDCDDGMCDANEDCAICPEDCGDCPPECGDGNLTPETGEECDDGNLLGGDGCDGDCLVEPQEVPEGALFVTELLKNPGVVEDSKGEWIEVYNNTDSDVDLNAWMLMDAGTDSHRIFALGGVIVPSFGYLVLGNNADNLTNGGVDVGYEFSGFNLGNGDDEVMLMSGEMLVDELIYTDADFPDDPGKSMILDGDVMDAVGNDDGANWCSAPNQWEEGVSDFGSPGMENELCPVCGDNVCNGIETCDVCDDCVCEEQEVCFESVCCNPMCENIDCGDDGCGGSCGTCDAGFVCEAGECTCTPDCDGKECGSDGCGGGCGTCDLGDECSMDNTCYTPNAGSCAGFCAETDENWACHCDAMCFLFDDCCEDICDECALDYPVECQ